MVDHVMPSIELERLRAVNSILPVRYADGSLLVEPRTQ
jgi:hypothetical protein